MSEKKIQEESLSQLEKCGMLLVYLSAHDNIPFSPMNFQKRVGEIEQKTGISTEELRELYKFLQEESFKMSLPANKKKLGFK